MIKVIEDFLPQSYFRELKDTIFGTNFPWTYNGATTPGKDNDVYFNHMGFIRELNNKDNPKTSPFYFDSKCIPYFIEDKYKFKIDLLYRINCTMVLKRPEVQANAFHTDYPFPHYTGILYMNNCNGPTYFKDQEIEFKENRFVFFDGSILHAASYQSDAERRVNIVFNMTGKHTNN